MSSVWIILLIAPGYISKKIYELLSDDIADKDNFQTIMESFVFSVFIIMPAYAMSALLGYDNYTDPKFIATYALTALVLSVVVAFAWRYIKPKFIGGINKARSNNITPGKATFDILFNDGEPHLVEVYNDNGLMITRGLIDHMYFDNKEFSLEDAEDCFTALNERGALQCIKTYVSLDSLTTVREYAIH